MIYISYDINGTIERVHHKPFDPIEGMGKTQAELEATGILVDEIPKAEHREGQSAVLCVDVVTKELYFKYADIPQNGQSVDEQIAKIASKLLNANERYQQLDKSTILIDDLKQFKIEQLKYFCSEAINDGFTSSINNYEFGFNELDQANFTQQTLLIVAAGGNYPSKISWKTKNVGVVELTVSDFNKIINEAATHKLTQQTKYWELEQKVLNALTLSAVDEIVW